MATIHMFTGRNAFLKEIRMWRVSAWRIVGDRGSHVNLIGHTLMAWTDVWTGNQQEKIKGHATRHLNKQHMFHWDGYSTLDWWVPTGADGSVWRLWQDVVGGDAALGPLGGFLFHNLSVSEAETWTGFSWSSQEIRKNPVYSWMHISVANLTEMELLEWGLFVLL